jgi:phosphoglycolate phosphatase-like HAD superfamily hydrolase
VAGVKIALDLDAALGDTHALWDAWLEDAARRYHSITPLDPGALPRERGAAAEQLDRWAEAGVGDWRGSLERFAEDHAPLYLRPDSDANAALRSLQAHGARLGAFTDAPEPLGRVALAQLGAARRLDAAEFGAGARERLLEALGEGAVVVGSREELLGRAGDP